MADNKQQDTCLQPKPPGWLARASQLWEGVSLALSGQQPHELLLLQETWERPSSPLAVPPDYGRISSMRVDRKGGGVCILYHQHSFECLHTDVSSPWYVACCLLHKATGQRLGVLNTYLPPRGSARGSEAAMVDDVLRGTARVQQWTRVFGGDERVLVAGDMNARVGAGLVRGVADGRVDGRGRALVEGMRGLGMEALNGGWEGSGGATATSGSVLDLAFGRGLAGPGIGEYIGYYVLLFV